MSQFIIDDLSYQWSLSEVNRGDTILLHSNLRRILLKLRKLNLKKNLNETVIKSFLNLLGEEGTLIMPLFNFDFTKGKIFDINKTKSQMGVMSEEFRNNFSEIRTGHPVYSFGIFGKKKNLFKNLDNFSAYSEESPFGILKKINGKIAVIDLEDQHSMTFYHHIEEVNNAHWRYHKIFKGDYVNIKREKSLKKYSIFVRRLDRNIITFVNPTGRLLWKENIYKGFAPGVKTGLRTIESKKMFDYVSQIIKSNRGKNLLYKIR